MKLQAHDLRLGNWIEQKGRHYQVTKSMMAHYLEMGCIDKPVPLTEDWLLRAGFEKDNYGAWNKSIAWYDDFFKTLSLHGDYLYLKEGDVPEHDICTLWNRDIQGEFYVHQLQNLFFALTGKELTKY